MRPLSWLSPLLCGVVLVAGGYAGLVGLGHTRWVVFVGGLVGLVVVDAVGVRWPAWPTLVVQAGLVVVVVA
ncbi:MAG: sensor histidine kinase, partial [Saccharothrix sp.]|nr:sensor histidine kinase [Saccharothrix sp.]